MEWDAPSVVLSARPYGESDLLATVVTLEHGLHRGLARGGASRAQSALWQPGSLAAGALDGAIGRPAWELYR